MTDKHTSWSSNLNMIQYVINNTYYNSIKSSLSKVLLGVLESFRFTVN